MTEQEKLIADQADLEAFVRLPPEQRHVTDQLRGVLAETAVTGVIRYPWPLVQPLLTHLMQHQLSQYEAEEHVEIGPARPILGGSDDSVEKLCERFSTLLAAFDGHPWTLQRLCELVLEPQKQYKRLSKLALAIEKLLLVTGELSVSEQPGPLPALSQLTQVNEAPPAPAGPTAAAAASNQGSRQGEADGSGLVAAALDIRPAPQQTSEATAASAVAVAAATDAAADPMQVDAVGLSDALPDAQEAAAAAAVGSQGNAVSGDGASMEPEAPAAGPTTNAVSSAAPSPAVTAAVVAAAAADVEMATEEVPALPPTDHSHTNAVGSSSVDTVAPPAETAGGGRPAAAQ